MSLTFLLVLWISSLLNSAECGTDEHEQKDGFIRHYIRILKNHIQDGQGITREECVSICKLLPKKDLQRCLSGACSVGKRWIDTTQYEKKWIDTTHYSEGRRSLYTGVEMCIRKLCNGMEGGDLKSCAFTCSRRRRRGVPSSMKRWVDPLSYGVHRV